MSAELELPPPATQRELHDRLRTEHQQHRRDAFDRRVSLVGRRVSDVGNFCYVGLLKVVQFPAYAFDLLNQAGRPDHTKIGPFLVSQELVAITAYDVIVNKRPLQAAVVMIIAVLSFASMSLMRKFLDHSSTAITAATSIEEKRVTETQTKYVKFTADGVPAESLPAVPGAATPAGES